MDPAAFATLVVVLFDGFSPQMVESVDTPALDSMRSEAAWTHRLEHAFPTLSLINQVTISTGCWPAQHGIVSNVFWDPEKGVYDHSADADWLTGCEHLHRAAERQGAASAALWWVGAHSGSQGQQATWVSKPGPWSEQPSDRKKARRVIQLLALPPDERPGLILVYMHGPDSAAHFEGLDADATRAVVAESDAVIGLLLEELRELRRTGHRFALAVTTDHGMAPVETVVNVERILGRRGIDARFHSSGTTSFLYLDSPEAVERAHAELSGHDAFEVLRRDEVAERFQLGASRRVGDLVLSARPPYFVEDIELWPWYARWLGSWGPELIWAGPFLAATHGYPHGAPGMDGLFYLWGDGVAPGELRGLRAVDIHPTLAAWLRIGPGQPVDGQAARSALDFESAIAEDTSF